MYRQSEKLLNSNTSSTCPHNMANFGLLTAEICWRVWVTPFQFQRLSRLGSVTARQSNRGRQANFAALNRGRHLYSAGRPSRLAHILVLVCFGLQFRCDFPDTPLWITTLGHGALYMCFLCYARESTYTESPAPVWLPRVEYQESQIGTGGQNIQEQELSSS